MNDILGSVLVVELPGTIFISLFTLIFLGKYYNDSYRIKGNILKILVKITLPIALIWGIISHTNDMNPFIKLFIGITLFTIIIYLNNQDRNIKDICFCVLTSVSILLILRLIGLIIAVYILRQDVLSSTSCSGLNGYLLMPERIMEFGILYIVYLSHNTDKTYNLVNTLKNNSHLRNTIKVIIIINIIISTVVLKYFIYGKQMLFISRDTQFMVISGMLILMIVNISFPWMILSSIGKQQQE
ncbi:MAG: hypothetical protein RR840_02200 [Clostridium sp.]